MKKTSLIMKNSLYTEPFEHYENEPKDYSNLYVGIAVGVMIIICAVIYVVVSVEVNS